MGSERVSSRAITSPELTGGSEPNRWACLPRCVVRGDGPGRTPSEQEGVSRPSATVVEIIRGDHLFATGQPAGRLVEDARTRCSVVGCQANRRSREIPSSLACSAMLKGGAEGHGQEDPAGEQGVRDGVEQLALRAPTSKFDTAPRNSAITAGYGALFRGAVFDPKSVSQGGSGVVRPHLEHPAQRHAADPRRPGGGGGVPHRSVQHRRAGPDDPGRDLRRVRRLRLELPTTLHVVVAVLAGCSAGRSGAGSPAG